MQIDGVSEAAFNALRAQLLSNQAEVTGTTAGTITGHGVTANYHYDTVGQTLSVDVIHHPFYIPVSSIESQLRDHSPPTIQPHSTLPVGQTIVSCGLPLAAQQSAGSSVG